MTFAATSIGCSATSADGEATPLTDADHLAAQTDYSTLCAGCHGERREGTGIAPALLELPYDHAQLTNIIDATMPTADPAQCSGQCASRMADYLLTPAEDHCDPGAPGVRQVRLLSQRELENTYATLLDGTTALGSPSAPVASSCPHEFNYAPPSGVSSVHVAGSFNDWSSSSHPFTESNGSWTLSLDLPEGVHTYKFVINGSEWITDPDAPTEDDGSGNVNSLVRLGGCGATASEPSLSAAARTQAADLARHIPPVTTPAGFAFDTHSASGTVSARFLEEAMAAAAAFAQDFDLATVVTCKDPTESCQAEAVTSLGHLVARRPLTEEEITRYATLFAAEDTFEAGARLVLETLLSSNLFLYREELGSSNGALNDYEAAAALSYGLTGHPPDAALLDVARRGELANSNQVETEARRLLETPLARRHMKDFAEQWLGLGALDTMVRDPSLYPDFNPTLAATMKNETGDFVAHIALEGAASELLRSSEGGLLAQRSLMSVHAHSDQTSPVRRGLFVRHDLLCQSLPEAPPDVSLDVELDPGLSTRERFEQHSADPACASCHQFIDPIGFAFESFDAIGNERTSDAGLPIEPGGVLQGLTSFGGDDGRIEFSSIADLGAQLSNDPAFYACLTKQVSRYQEGISRDASRACDLKTLATDFYSGDQSIADLMIALVTQPAFLERN